MHLLKMPADITLLLALDKLANDPLTWDGVMSLVICTDVALNYIKI